MEGHHSVKSLRTWYDGRKTQCDEREKDRQTEESAQRTQTRTGRRV